MDLFSLDSVILIIVICNCLPFSSSRSIFRRHISWQVLKIAFRSLQIWKFFWGRTPPDPPTRLVPSALAIMPLVTKNLATALGNAKKNKLCHFKIPFKSRERKGDLIYKLSSFIHWVHVLFSISSVVNIDNIGILNLVWLTAGKNFWDLTGDGP